MNDNVLQPAIAATPKDEWMTPEWLIAGVKAFAGKIDLDPATSVTANQHYIQAPEIYVKEETKNGLWNDWDAEVTWCNPPFSETGQWVDKTWGEYATFRGEIFLLTPTPHGDTWAYSLLEAPRVLFFSRRISFVDPATMQPVKGNMQGSMLTYFGHRPAKFSVYFEQWGRILRMV